MMTWSTVCDDYGWPTICSTNQWWQDAGSPFAILFVYSADGGVFALFIGPVFPFQLLG